MRAFFSRHLSPVTRHLSLVTGSPGLAPRAPFSLSTRWRGLGRGRLAPGLRVISGTYWFAAGGKSDDAAIKPYGPGTVIVVPAGAPHFSACKDGEAVVQEAGVGPTGITIIK